MYVHITSWRLLDFRDLLYAICYANYSGNSSYSTAVDNMHMENIVSVTKSAFIHKRVKCNADHFKRLNDKIIAFIYKNCKVRRLIATDGTYVYVIELAKKDKIKLSENKHCCKLRINALYDIDTGIPIDYALALDFNEREALKTQFNNLNEDDIVLHDGGYYSEELVIYYISKNVHAIFILPSSSRHIRLFKSNINDVVTTVYLYKYKKYVTLRFIKFQTNTDEGIINNYICTTLINSYTREYIIRGYHERWDLETHFKHVKYNNSLDCIKSKSLNTIKQDIYINQFICIICSYIESLLTPFIKKPADREKYYSKINTTSCTDLVKKYMMKPIIYNIINDNTEGIFNKLKETLIKSAIVIKKKRSFKRIRKRPVGKWTISGGTSGRPHTKKKTTKKKENTKKSAVKKKKSGIKKKKAATKKKKNDANNSTAKCVVKNTNNRTKTDATENIKFSANAHVKRCIGIKKSQ